LDGGDPPASCEFSMLFHCLNSICDYGESTCVLVSFYSLKSLHIGIQQYVSREKAGTGWTVVKIFPALETVGSARSSFGFVLFRKQ